MEIVFLSFYSGEIFRGVETLVHELSNALVSLGHKVHVYQNGNALNGAKYITHEIKLPIIWNCDGGKIKSSFFIDYWSLMVKNFSELSLKSISHCDVIIPTNDGWQSFLVKAWARKNNIPLVILGMSGTCRRDLVNLWTFPNMFIGFTDFQINWAKKHNPWVKTLKIPIGVNMQRFYPSKPNIDLDLPKPIILTVGALESIKRQALLLKGAINAKASVLIVGQGTLKQELLTMGNELLGSERFKICTFPYDRMPDVYRGCDVFAFPTDKKEAFGNVLLEAMACGLPVVTINDSIRREIVGDAGIFVNPENRVSFSKCLDMALLKDWRDIPVLQATKFSLENVAQRYSNIFTELISC